MEYTGLLSISLHKHFPQTSVFLESQAGSKPTGDFFNQFTYEKMATHPTGFSMDVPVFKRGDQEGVHAKNMKFLSLTVVGHKKTHVGHKFAFSHVEKC